MENSPISTLPVELLVKIFQATYALGSSPPEDPSSASTTPATTSLDICHVCQRWREAALSCKYLWTDIPVREHTSMEFLDFLWAQKRDAPVSLTIIGPATNAIAYNLVFDAVASRIRANPHEIRSLAIATREARFARLFEPFPGLLSNLENFDARIVANDHGSLLLGSLELGKLISDIKAPKLRTIRLCENIEIPWSSPFMQSYHLTEMHNRFGTDEEQRDSTTLYRLLARSINLRELSVYLKYDSMDRGSMLLPSPMDLTHIVNLELSCNQWSFSVQNFLRSIRISWHNMTRFAFRTGSSFHRYIPLVNQFWDDLRSASSDTYLSPQKFEVGTASHCNFIEAQIDTSNGERPPLELRIEIRAALLFRSPKEYQAAWSFKNLQHIEIRDSLPHYLWSLLIEHPHLQHVGVHSQAAVILLTILTGTSSSFSNKTAVLFPALRTLGVLDQPSHRWSRMRGSDESFPDYGPQERSYTAEEEYALDFVSALRGRALRIESLVDADGDAEPLLSEIHFHGCKLEMAQDIREALELVAKDVVWSRAGS